MEESRRETERDKGASQAEEEILSTKYSEMFVKIIKNINHIGDCYWGEQERD